jgi:hypothetical protein
VAGRDSTRVRSHARSWGSLRLDVSDAWSDVLVAS